MKKLLPLTIISIAGFSIWGGISLLNLNIAINIVSDHFRDKESPDYTPLDSIVLSRSSIDLKIGELGEITATIYPENATDKDIIWEIKPEIATINEYGVITPKATGEASIFATNKTGEVTTKCNLHIWEDTEDKNTVEVDSVSIDDIPRVIKSNNTHQLYSVISPENATVQSIIWQSSNASVATVSNNGLVTAISSGDATITLTVNGISATCSIKVEADIIQDPPPPSDTQDNVLLVRSRSLPPDTITIPLYPNKFEYAIDINAPQAAFNLMVDQEKYISYISQSGEEIIGDWTSYSALHNGENIFTFKLLSTDYEEICYTLIINCVL